jgi:hypothetical protein
MPVIRALEYIINAITMPVRQLVTWFVNCLPSIRYLQNRSVPFQWALTSFIALVVLISSLIVLKFFVQSDIPLSDLYRVVLIPLFCLIVIPPIVYQFVKILLSKEESPYPEIQEIWDRGVARAREKGFEWSQAQLPVYLVLGTDGGPTNAQILESLGGVVLVQEPPSGESTISFLLIENHQRVCVWVLTQGCSCISGLKNAVMKDRAISRMVNRTDDRNQRFVNRNATVDANDFDPDDRIKPMDAPAAINEGVERTKTEYFSPDDPAVAAKFIELQMESNKLSENQLSEIIWDRTPKLAYLCKLIQQTSGDFPEIDGVMTLLPANLIDSATEQIIQVAREDISCLSNSLRIRIPNLICITSMETCPGFLEFAARQLAKASQDSSDSNGSQSARGQSVLNSTRIGYGAESIWIAPTTDRVSTIANNGVNSLIDMTQQFFYRTGTSDALPAKGNRDLFRFLKKLRGGFSENLTNTLVNAFACDFDSSQPQNLDPFPIVGCYFVASGQARNEQRFLPAVLSKVMDSTGSFKWTQATIDKDRRYQSLANILTFLSVMIFLAIVMLAWMLIYKKSS